MHRHLLIITQCILSLSGAVPLFADAVPEEEWLVTRRAGVSWEEVSQQLGSAWKLKHILPSGDHALFVGPGVVPTGDEGSFTLQPNFTYHALDGDDPSFEESWGLVNSGQPVNGSPPGIAGKDIGAADGWKISRGSADVVVAVLDSGIALTHEDLVHNLWRNPREIAGNGKDDDANGFIDDIFGWNALSGTPHLEDENGHGTGVASVIGAEGGNGLGTRGVNWKVSLMSVKVLDKFGSGTSAGAIAGIEYAVKNGARIINASWGGRDYDLALYETVRKAGEKGVLFVAASGNDGKNNDTDPYPTYPASYRLPNVISVAAYDQKDMLTKFSNFGKGSVHIAAPGISIFSAALTGYRYAEGTSFAAPFVSGVGALVLSRAPTLSMEALRERLLATSEVIGYYEKERVSSGGRVHAGNALLDVRPPRPTAPTAWITSIESWGSPHPYANSSSLTYRITRPQASHIRVRFSSFETETCCDKVVLRDGAGLYVTSYSGKLGEFWSADALGDTMVIEFTSDFSIAKPGFEIDAVGAHFSNK